MQTTNFAHSPSLAKMEGHGGRNDMRRGKRFSLGNIIGDPFALATISIAILAWLLAFVSSIITAISYTYPKFGWWTIVFMFFCIVGIIITIGSGAVYTYHVAIVGYLAAGLILTSSAVNQLIYNAEGAPEAAAAGFILLSIVNIVWIFYFGSQPQASHRSFVDSFALSKGDRPSPHVSRQMSNRYAEQPQGSYAAAHPPSQMYGSNHLNGLETSSPNYPVGTINSSNSQQRYDGSMFAQSQDLAASQADLGQAAPSEISAIPAEYKYRAKAIYSYEQNPDDANELSFSKNDILEVSDVSGRWWQARKSNGETGIAPSNYLILL